MRGRSLSYRLWFVAVAAVAVVFAVTGPAFAIHEPAAISTCATCHSASLDQTACPRCHENMRIGNSVNDLYFTGQYVLRGPHGLYSTTTSRCDMCHTLHDAPSGFRLLPAATVKDTCSTCHDGTGGQGVYNAILVRTGAPAGGGHAIQATNVVPGGNAATGGSSTVAFRGPAGSLTCSDCHSPHDSNTVEPFTGERVRIATNAETRAPGYSARLLKKRPTGATADVPVYGSDWCMACHAGRGSGGAVHNHPVDSLSVRADAFWYENIPVYVRDSSFSSPNHTLLKALSFRMSGLGGVYSMPEIHEPSMPTSPANWAGLWYGAGWLMAYPRNALQAGHGPICQQCHEDSREAGELRNNGTEVWLMGESTPQGTADGRIYESPPGTFRMANPRFQNFPHETENANLLLETGDDLCLNCHPAEVLP